jgi:hypothetical protein
MGRTPPEPSASSRTPAEIQPLNAVRSPVPNRKTSRRTPRLMDLDRLRRDDGPQETPSRAARLHDLNGGRAVEVEDNAGHAAFPDFKDDRDIDLTAGNLQITPLARRIDGVARLDPEAESRVLPVRDVVHGQKGLRPPKRHQVHRHGSLKEAPPRPARRVDFDLAHRHDHTLEVKGLVRQVQFQGALSGLPATSNEPQGQGDAGDLDEFSDHLRSSETPTGIVHRPLPSPHDRVLRPFHV